MWIQNQLIEFDADSKDPIKFDLCAAIGYSFLELIKKLPRQGLEDKLVTPNDDLQNVYNVFVDTYEEVHGTITNKGKQVNSSFAQVKIGIVNDSNSYDDLMHNLHKVLEFLK